MYNQAANAYRNLPIMDNKQKKSSKSFGLLSRNSETKQVNDGPKGPKERVAEYVMEIRKEREKLKNG
jgi:hypothetical protein